MAYYDRYGNLLHIEVDEAISIEESDVNYASTSLLYTDEGTTAKTGVLYDAPYWYSNELSHDTDICVTITGNKAASGAGYSAFYEYVGELIEGEGTTAPTVYNIVTVGDGSVPSGDWEQSIVINVKAGRRLAILYYRNYTEITAVTVEKVESPAEDEQAIEQVGSQIPLLSDVLSSELTDFAPLIYNFPQQTDDYVATNQKTLNISDEEFLALYYDNWIGTHRDGFKVTKHSIGLDETGTYHMYEYDFCPKSYTYTILLTSGLHPYELSASFGLAWFMKRYVEAIDGTVSDDGFDYLRKHVRIKCIPILNPWGFNQSPKKYGNVHGVNINRNVTFTWSGGTDAWTHKPSEPGSEWEWKGTAPWSEQETRNIRDWVTANQDAVLWIDCHTNVNNSSYDVYALFRNTYDSNDELSVYTAGAIRAQNALVEHIRTTYNKANPAVAPRTESLDTISDDYGITNYAQCTFGMWQNTIEQSPSRTTWGTAANNEGSDITEYAISIYAYLLGSTPHNVDAETWIQSLINS